MPRNLGTREHLPVLSTAPSSPSAGDTYYDSDDNTAYVWNSSIWEPMSNHTFWESYTWAIGGEIKVPSGDTDYIPPMFVLLNSLQTCKLVEARHRINSGTSATVKLQKNGSDITGWTGISVTSTSTTTDSTDTSISDGDMIALVVTAVSGTPKNMSFTLVLEHIV